MEENFDKIRITLASDETIREWSHGEVKTPETINFRTLKAEKDGLFCEKIFGPTKDWECLCGKYKKFRYQGIVCDHCGVEITRKKVRRERMGHIELAAPVAHIWYFKGVPNRLALMLDVSPKALERVVYFASYIVLESNVPTIKVGEILNETEYMKAMEDFAGQFVAKAGSEAIEVLLKRIDLDELEKKISEDIKNQANGKIEKLLKRLETVQSFKRSGNRPENMIMNVIPVIPPDLRPMVQLDGGRFATADLNDLYRRVLNRNNRLKKFISLGAPEIMLKNEKRMLQEAVDALIDNTKKGKPVTGGGNRALKSLSDMLKGKQGRFRQNLLGKRVDYSGRSVIVVGPELKLYQCGLPKEIALELFKPFVMRELLKDNLAANIKSAKRMVEQSQPEVWDELEKVIQDHPVLLNRAPTLHRLGIQAFEPVLVEGRAIKLHPLTCAAFNADFDGDQMAVHLPLSPEAQAEARYLMLSTNNLLKPKDGQPITIPSQDMILGAYYLTMDVDGAKGEGGHYKDKDEVLMALNQKIITLQSKIFVRMFDSHGAYKTIKTTPGRIIYNEGIPQDLGYVDRKNNDTRFNLEIDFVITKKNIEDVIARCIRIHGLDRTVKMLDFIKSTGYKYSTLSSITVSIDDVSVPKEKADILKKADMEVAEVFENYRMGLLSEEDRYNSVVAIWTRATDEVQKAMEKNFDKFNPIYMMAHSGARGNMKQLRQIAGMRGLMADTNDRTVEIPIKDSFREGLDALEYFISSHGARKGLADTALRTANSGYLTRRLVDVAQDIVIREEDCKSNVGILVSSIVDAGRVIETLKERIIGRFPVNDIINKETKETICDTSTLIDEDIAQNIIDAGITEVEVRTVITCRCKYGTCRKCYGKSLAAKGLVNIGESVGIIAAQAIGEPGTQLTMRTHHEGGVAGHGIAQGLPRVEELFEARKPKGVAIISEIDGEVEVNFKNDKSKLPEIIVKGEDTEKTYFAEQKVLAKFVLTDEQKEKKEKVFVKKGEPLTEGALNPNDLLTILGVGAVYRYIIQEVQKAYRNQGVDINDKHLEIITRQMLRKFRITDPGDSDLYMSDYINIIDLENINKELEAQGKRKVKAKQLLLGITKASLFTESFLSAASFQETTRVLTDAAIKGKVDNLVGLNENVIIGKLIPAGTGMAQYNNFTTNTKLQDEALKIARAEKEKELEKLNINVEKDEEY